MHKLVYRCSALSEFMSVPSAPAQPPESSRHTRETQLFQRTVACLLSMLWGCGMAHNFAPTHAVKYMYKVQLW